MDGYLSRRFARTHKIAQRPNRYRRFPSSNTTVFLRLTLSAHVFLSIIIFNFKYYNEIQLIKFSEFLCSSSIMADLF